MDCKTRITTKDDLVVFEELKVRAQSNESARSEFHTSLRIRRARARLEALSVSAHSAAARVVLVTDSQLIDSKSAEALIDENSIESQLVEIALQLIQPRSHICIDLNGGEYALRRIAVRREHACDPAGDLSELLVFNIQILALPDTATMGDV